MQDYRRLRVWRKAHALAVELHGITRAFPPIERYGLTAQMRRSAASIGSNIAEGAARSSDREFARFLSIAIGSATETSNHVLMARDLDLIDEPTYRDLEARTSEVRRMLIGLRARLLA